MDKSVLDQKSDQQIEQCLHLLKEVLGDDLLGVYLYGSSIVGGLQRYSDLDLLVVCSRPTTHEDKLQLVSNLLKISGIYRSAEKRPIETIIVVYSEINPWHYPPGFDFQYGDWLRNKFEKGDVEPWPTKIMPDLALLITQVLLGSRTMYGKEPNELLPRVPYIDFMNAVTEELDTLRVDLESDTRNVLLTFARIWSTVETDAICSKQKAAEWAIKRLPVELQPAIQRALVTARSEQEEKWDDLEDVVSHCADFMMHQIRKKMEIIKSSDTTSNTIKLVS